MHDASATGPEAGTPSALRADARDVRIPRTPVQVLFGAREGRYPQGNSLLVEGRSERVLIDPSLRLRDPEREPPRVDRVLLSHCHEDHVAGLGLYPDLPCHVHEADRPGLESLDGLLAVYGYPTPVLEAFRPSLLDEFHYVPRPDAETFRDGDVFDLGGVRIEVQHLPGHTRGHSGLWVRWPEDEGGVLYLGDIDLSGFGPYYGDAWSDLGDFEDSLERARGLEARWYATFHHIGVLAREAFLARLERFAAVIRSREERLLAFLAEPRSLSEIVRHRFVYRPSDVLPFADAVEERSMIQHLDRLVRNGRVVTVTGDRFQAG